MNQTEATAGRPLRKRKKKSRGEIVFMTAMLAVPVAHFCLFWLYVNIDTIFLSFKQFKINDGVWEWAGLANYGALFREFTKPGSVLPRAVLNSLSVFLWNDFVVLPVSLFCAYVLYKKMPLGGAFKVIFFLPSIISVVVLTLAYSYMFNNFLPELFEKIGLSKLIPFDGFFGDEKYAWWMILIYGLWSGIGYNIVLMSGAMSRVPEEVVEAGKLDVP